MQYSRLWRNQHSQLSSSDSIFVLLRCFCDSCEPQCIWQFIKVAVCTIFHWHRQLGQEHQRAPDNSVEDRVFVGSPLLAKSPVAIASACLWLVCQHMKWTLLACWAPAAALQLILKKRLRRSFLSSLLESEWSQCISALKLLLSLKILFLVWSSRMTNRISIVLQWGLMLLVIAANTIASCCSQVPKVGRAFLEVGKNCPFLELPTSGTIFPTLDLFGTFLEVGKKNLFIKGILWIELKGYKGGA